jgi:hypothetical protein
MWALLAGRASVFNSCGLFFNRLGGGGSRSDLNGPRNEVEKRKEWGLILSELFFQVDLTFMRQLSINGQVKPRWTAEERELFKGLVRISNDIHKLRETAREEGVLSCMLHFEKYRDHIDYVIERLTRDELHKDQ